MWAEGGGAHLSSWAAGHVVGMAGNCRAGFAYRARQVVIKVYGVALCHAMNRRDRIARSSSVDPASHAKSSNHHVF